MMWESLDGEYVFLMTGDESRRSVVLYGVPNIFMFLLPSPHGISALIFGDFSFWNVVLTDIYFYCFNSMLREQTPTRDGHSR